MKAKKITFRPERKESVKKSVKKAVIVSMAAIAGTSVGEVKSASDVAMRDMEQEFGKGKVCHFQDFRNPFWDLLLNP